MRRRLEPGHSAGLHARARRRTGPTEYDWRTREAALNRFDQFTTEIDGLDIHFIHQRSPHPDAFPLVITHGWPGSIVEFGKVIEPLTDPTAHGGRAEDAFHVVCPSLPGYGFSGKPTSDRLERRQDRRGVGDVDGPARLRALRRPGRGLGLARSPPTSAATSATASGIHTNMPIGGPTASAMREPDRRGEGRARGDEPLPEVGTPATSSSSPPDRRRSATAWSTPRRRSWPGSSRSSGRGPTATATPRTRSAATKCSTT